MGIHLFRSAKGGRARRACKIRIFGAVNGVDMDLCALLEGCLAVGSGMTYLQICIVCELTTAVTRAFFADERWLDWQ